MIHSVPNQPPGMRMRVPLRGQQSPNQEQLVALQQAQDAQAIRAMAGSMYVQLAVSELADGVEQQNADINEGKLRLLATQCMIAAKVFLEGVAIVQSTDDSEVEPDGREDRQGD